MNISNGLKTFYTLVTDLSGNGVSGYDAFINVEFVVNDIPVSTTVTEITGSILPGLYAVESDIGNTGAGYIAFTVDDPTLYNITPTYEMLTVTEYDVDNTFAAIRAATNIPNQSRVGGNYSRVYETLKLNDAYIQSFDISATEMRNSTGDLTGWTDFEFEIYPTESNTTTASALFTGTVSVASSTDPAQLDVIVPSVSGDLIADGYNFVTLYCDLSGVNPDGYKVTLKEIILKVVRNY